MAGESISPRVGDPARRLGYRGAPMRLIEIRLLEGPNLYRLQPVVKVEVAIGRTRTWYGDRVARASCARPPRGPCPARDWPDDVASLVAWLRRLRTEYAEAGGPIAVHRSSDPGHWIVTFPWTGAERAHEIADAAVHLTERNASPSRSTRLTGTQQRLLDRARLRIESARATPPAMITDADRRIPVISISGTNGKTTVTRLVTHILFMAGRHVGTTTSDGVLVDERVVEPGDWTGPGGAQRILARSDLDVAVLETARGGILLRGVGYQSNEASVLTNISLGPSRHPGHSHAAGAGRGQVGDRAHDEARRLGGAQRRRSRSWQASPGECAPMSRCSRRRRGLLRSCGATWRPAGAPTCSNGTDSWSARGRAAERRSSMSRTSRSRSAALRATTWPTRSLPRVAPGRWARPSKRSRTGCGTSGRRWSARRDGSTSSGSGTGS